MLSYIKEGDIIIDVGTNIGCSVMNFALKTGSDGKIYGFEPDIINYNQCKKHINLNKFENISLYNIGIGNNSGKYNLIIDDPNNRGTNKISINDKSKIKKESIEVLITTIDEWVLKNKIEKINVIKIDVEGFDLKVIEGAEETIKKYNPILFVELDNNNLLKVNDSAVKLIHKLNQLNYECREIISNQLIDTSYTNFENCHFDIICIKTK
jgi:FkbM family methyltransferase